MMIFFLVLAGSRSQDQGGGRRGPGLDRPDPRRGLPRWRRLRRLPEGRSDPLPRDEQAQAWRSQEDQHVRGPVQVHGEH